MNVDWGRAAQAGGVVAITVYFGKKLFDRAVDSLFNRQDGTTDEEAP